MPHGDKAEAMSSFYNLDLALDAHALVDSMWCADKRLWW